MSRLRKEKKRLLAQIEDEKVELFSEVEKYKNSLWPFRAMNKFRKTVETLSENKLVVLGAQLAYSALKTAKEGKVKREDSDSADASSTHEEKSDMKSSVVDFLKNTAKNFLENYVKVEEK